MYGRSNEATATKNKVMKNVQTAFAFKNAETTIIVVGNSQETTLNGFENFLGQEYTTTEMLVEFTDQEKKMADSGSCHVGDVVYTTDGRRVSILEIKK